MLDELKIALESIGEKAEVIKVLDQQKREKEILVIRHGNFSILLNPVNKTYVNLIVRIQIKPEDGAKLASQSKEFHDEFGFILQREMLVGKIAYNLVVDESKKPSELREIQLMRNVIVETIDNVTKQQLSDSIQELVNVGLRIGSILGTTFSSIKGSTSDRKSYDGPMYG
ncbi:MAG: hypothetical protein HZB92_03385 [Euryarchaeota archaeon]|nr:hypothetical protein [Euryarchaeota archaeon]